MNTSPAVSVSSPFDNPSRFGGRAPEIAGASSVPESPFDSQPTRVRQLTTPCRQNFQ